MVVLQAVEATTPVAAEALPRCGLFYSAKLPFGPPLPCAMGWSAWNLGEDSFGQSVWLLDDLDQPQMQMRTMAMDAPSPGGDAGGGGTYMLDDYTPASPDYGTNLWIAQVGISSGSLMGIVSNTLADVYYELQSKSDLQQTGWDSPGWFVYGSETTNWTPFSVPMSSPSNLFVRIRSWADDGSGLPIWWQMQYFGTAGIDPYGDPMGDGWNNLQNSKTG